MDQIEYDYISDLSFDNKSNRLEFRIIHYTKTPKITRYVQRNYVKTPIYGDYSERTKELKKFNKVINPIKFVNEDILTLKLEKKFILNIIKEIGIIPKWREKEIKLENINKQIKIYKQSFKKFSIEKWKYNYKNTQLQEYPSNFWLRLFLGFFTLFLSFIGFVSKEQAIINKNENEKNKKWNNNHKIEIDLKNKKLLEKITTYNNNLIIEIGKLQDKYYKIKNEKINLEKIDKDGWIDLRNSLNFNYQNLNAEKGVYIIWNKTKNKHYVGQSKNMKNRLLQHFKNGEVKNTIFAKDWYNGDEFSYTYYFCKTKDELDTLEKKYIDTYFAFEKGYNSTNGNR